MRNQLSSHKEVFFLILLLSLFFLLRLPSLFEPNWYGDEGIYQVVGKAITQGRALYQGIWDNKPPVLYLLYALTSADLFSTRLLFTIIGAFSITAFFLLSKSLFTKRKVTFIATSFFALSFGLPLLEGNIANAENFMLLPILIAGILIWRNTNLLTVGFLLSIAFLTKTVALFDFTSFFLFLVFIQSWKKPRETLKKFSKIVAPLFIGFLFPIISVALFFYIEGSFQDFLSATLVQSVDYISYGNAFIVKQGFLMVKLALLGLFVFTLFWYRKLFSKTHIFIMLWLAFSLFNAFFAQRPYTHYLLVLLPSFSLLIGSILDEKKHKFISIFLCLFLISIIPKNFWIYTDIFPYYQNFFDFVTSKKSIEEYQSFFDRNVPRDYEVSQFIKMHTSDQEKVFIWGDSAQVYILSGKLPPGRLAVSYHVTFYPDAFQETIKAIDETRPKYIVLLSQNGRFDQLLQNYSLSFVLAKGGIIYERKL